MGSDVTRDALQEAPAVRAGRLDKEGDPWATRCPVSTGAWHGSHGYPIVNRCKTSIPHSLSRALRTGKKTASALFKWTAGAMGMVAAKNAAKTQ